MVTVSVDDGTVGVVLFGGPLSVGEVKKVDD